MEKYPCGLVEISIEIEENKIKEITIEGDFFSELGISPLCKALEGVECSLEAITKTIDNLDLEKYIKGMEKKAFIGDIMKLIEANSNGKKRIC